MLTTERVAVEIPIDITTILDLLAPHIIDLIDDKVDQIFGDAPNITWADYSYSPNRLNARIIDNHLVVTVDFDLYDEVADAI